MTLVAQYRFSGYALLDTYVSLGLSVTQASLNFYSCYAVSDCRQNFVGDRSIQVFNQSFGHRTQTISLWRSTIEWFSASLTLSPIGSRITESCFYQECFGQNYSGVFAFLHDQAYFSSSIGPLPMWVGHCLSIGASMYIEVDLINAAPFRHYYVYKYTFCTCPYK